jgi:hypothetical protein
MLNGTTRPNASGPSLRGPVHRQKAVALAKKRGCSEKQGPGMIGPYCNPRLTTVTRDLHGQIYDSPICTALGGRLYFLRTQGRVILG